MEKEVGGKGGGWGERGGCGQRELRGLGRRGQGRGGKRGGGEGQLGGKGQQSVSFCQGCCCWFYVSHASTKLSFSQINGPPLLREDPRYSSPPAPLCGLRRPPLLLPYSPSRLSQGCPAIILLITPWEPASPSPEVASLWVPRPALSGASHSEF